MTEIEKDLRKGKLFIQQDESTSNQWFDLHGIISIHNIGSNQTLIEWHFIIHYRDNIHKRDDNHYIGQPTSRFLKFSGKNKKQPLRSKLRFRRPIAIL